jgi:hypothetical protein
MVNPAAAALAEFVHRRGLERASEVLKRWRVRGAHPAD